MSIPCKNCNLEKPKSRCDFYSVKCAFYSQLPPLKTSKDYFKCWKWQGYKTSRGYGQIMFNEYRYLTHRLSFQLFKNSEQPIPKKKGHQLLYICHSCDVPSCVNPSHLFLGTARDNCKDYWQKKKMKKLINYLRNKEN